VRTLMKDKRKELVGLLRVESYAYILRCEFCLKQSTCFPFLSDTKQCLGCLFHRSELRLMSRAVVLRRGYDALRRQSKVNTKHLCRILKT
jgi:hypothetical protein